MEYDFKTKILEAYAPHIKAFEESTEKIDDVAFVKHLLTIHADVLATVLRDYHNALMEHLENK